jgi:chemotaxis family two-component system response regulator PixH
MLRSATLKNKPKRKAKNPAVSTAAQIEKHLHQAIKLHNHLWQATQNSLIEISQIIELLKNSNQLPAKNDTSGSSPNEKTSRKAGQNTQKTIKEVNHQQLEALLIQRLNSLDMIKRHLHSADFITGESIDLPVKVESIKPKNILIVDDDPISIKLTSHFLQKAEYAVTCAVDGKEGLRKALENPPDIILIDIMMPGLDGFQLLTQLKKEAMTSRIPVLILSSLCNEQEIIRGLKEGAVDFITKPFSPQVLLAKLEKTIDLRK